MHGLHLKTSAQPRGCAGAGVQVWPLSGHCTHGAWVARRAGATQQACRASGHLMRWSSYTQYAGVQGCLCTLQVLLCALVDWAQSIVCPLCAAHLAAPHSFFPATTHRPSCDHTLLVLRPHTARPAVTHCLSRHHLMPWAARRHRHARACEHEMVWHLVCVCCRSSRCPSLRTRSLGR